MMSVVSTSLIALGIGCLVQFVQHLLGSSYVNRFLEENLINLLVALLAINSATMGIILTKIRELVDKHGRNLETFSTTKKAMLLSIKEHIALIAVGLLLLTLSESKNIPITKDVGNFIQSILTGVFVYSMALLYDTAKGVLIIVDFTPQNTPE